MLRRNNNALKNTTAVSAAFTLVELILVMVVMVTILAFVAPTLGRSFKQRGLDEQAVRMLALTEYGRDEAISEGVPTQVWIDPISGNFGVEAVPGYPDREIRTKQYSLPADVHFELAKINTQPPRRKVMCRRSGLTRMARRRRGPQWRRSASWTRTTVPRC